MIKVKNSGHGSKRYSENLEPLRDTRSIPSIRMTMLYRFVIGQSIRVLNYHTTYLTLVFLWIWSIDSSHVLSTNNIDNLPD
jgi:hypothetical protein